LVIMVTSFNENSILPVSFILEDEKHLGGQAKGHSNDLAALQLNSLSLKKVEKVLSSLEDSIFTHSVKHNAKHKYKRFEKFRLSFFARKVQNAFRTFLTKDSAIPRPLRYIIRPGYLGGGGHLFAESIQLQQPPLPLLKSRRVYLEPWILQSLVSNIYAYKLTYDIKAMKISQPLVTLPNATSSFLLMLFSSIDLVERTMHDLCLGIQTYMHGCPRLRLFAAFLGFGEVEDPISHILTEEIMLTSYLELLAVIHKEVAYKKTMEYSPIVPVLFPASEDPVTRTDKRDVWLLPLTTLTRALGQWAGIFKGFKSDIWENALTRIKRTKDGLTEVDDFMWVIMLTLAKTIANRYRKCEDQSKSYTLKEVKIREYKQSISTNQSSASNQNSDVALVGGFVNRTTSGILADHALEDQKLYHIKIPHGVNITSLQNSLNLIHGKNLSINDANADDETTIETDLQQCCTCYIPVYSNYRNCNYKIYTKLLQQCILWDSCSGTCLLENKIEDNTSESEKKDEFDPDQLSEEKHPLNHRSSIQIQSAVPPALFLRYFSWWWNSQKDLVATEIKEIEVHSSSYHL
jgi:hypothetical protein